MAESADRHRVSEGPESEADELEDIRFVLSPPNVGEMQITLAIGSRAQLTPKLEAAIEALAKELQEREVQALLREQCNPVVVCNPLSCGGVTICNLTVGPKKPVTIA
ncbi:MAG TPA: hypothetical protein VMF05_01725 [Stellaceae bacterium]|nr:hypothetical protein [Stellaceae bacterium]